jgi:drug/metabolite transporter (DMT)-like permease
VRAIAIAEGLAAVLVWGASFIATKVALRDASPITVVWTRFVIGTVILAVVAAARREAGGISPRDAAACALLGLQGITFHQWLQSTALVTSGAATSGWIVASTPVFIAMLGWLWLRERLTSAQAAGIALAAVGVVLVATRGDLLRLLHGRLGAPGDVLIMISAPNWAVFSVLSRGLLRRLSAARMVLLVTISGTLGSSALLAAGPGLSELAGITPRGWVAIAFLGVLCSGFAYVFWFDALKALSASRAGAFLYLEPIVAQVVAALVLGERVRAVTVAGGLVVLLGVWLVNRERTAQPAAPAEA